MGRELTAALAFGVSMAAFVAPAQARQPGIDVDDPGQGSPAGQSVTAEEATADPADYGEIIVSARRREERAQTVPASLDVFTSARLEASGITNSFSLQSNTPGLAMAPADRELNLSIRGIANNVRSIGADPSNAASLNGVYLPRANMALTELFDIQRVEVLRGPQGTLYGRNSTGGAINIVSQDPQEELTADGYVGVGSFGLLRAQGGISAGNDIIQFRVAANYAKDDGYTRNSFNGTRFDQIDYLGLRGTVQLTPTSNFKLKAFWQHSADDSGLGYGLSLDPTFGSSPTLSYALLTPRSTQRVSPRNIRIDVEQFGRRRGDVAGLIADWDLGSIALRSITGYARYRSNDSQDADGTSVPYEYQVTSQYYRSYSQEFQAFSSNNATFDWIAGAFFYRDRGAEFIDYQYNPLGPNGLAYRQLAGINTFIRSKSEAIYGQATYRFTDQFSLTAGGRYTWDDKRGGREQTPTFTAMQASTRSQKFTPSFQLQYKPSADVMFYANVTEGYKSGGVNGQDTTGNPTFRPENVWSYEAGFKSQFLDRRVTLNIAAFHMDYKDIQFRTAIIGSGGILIAVTNAASADIDGAELEFNARLGGGWSVDLNGAYLDTSVKNFTAASGVSLDGRPMPLSPKWSGAAGLNFENEIGSIGRLRARLEYTYRSRTIFPQTYDAVYNSDGPLSLVNATLRWTAPSGHFYVEAIGRNLTDRLYRVNHQDYLPYYVLDAYGSPRTLEARIGFKF